MKKTNEILTEITKEDLKLLISNPKKFWEGITEIGTGAFNNCSALTSIKIPSSVTKIGTYAFSDCDNLVSIKIPESVTEIGTYAFTNCRDLKSIEIPESVTKIGDRAFNDCSALTSIEIPESVTKIGDRAFNNCSALKSIKIPESVTEIADEAFSCCSALISIEIPSSVTKIGTYAFSYCDNLVSIKIPESVTKIGDRAFNNCSALTSIEIPEGVTEIGGGAFNNCSALTSIKIPSSITKIDAYAFRGCSGLKSIEIPKTVTEIGTGAFSNCSNLTKIKYGDLVFEKNNNGVWTTEYNGIKLKITDFLNSKEFYNKLFFLKAARSAGIEKIPFLPHSSVFKNIKTEDLKYFFANSKAYSALQKEFARYDNATVETLLDESREDFFKLCYISGLFSPSKKERESSEKFIRENIVGKFKQAQLHERFSGLETSNNGYNPKFAEFLKENYSPDFLIKDFFENQEDGEGFELDETKINFFSQAYDQFNQVLEAYPNSEVKTTTNRDRLTEEQIFDFLQNNKYENVGIKKYPELTEAISKKCNELAQIVGKYGYSQMQFEKLQDWFIQGIKSGTKISCEPDAQTNKITYELLNKSNPFGAVLGNVTNCCQKVDDAGESCVQHGMSEPNGGFVVFKYGKRVIGQAWVWYNEDMKKVCFDNIEVPNSAQEIVKKNYDGFISCLKRASSSILKSMNENGNKVKVITMGKGYNDLLKAKNDEYFQNPTQKETGGAPIGYTDIKSGEVQVLSTIGIAALISSNSASPVKELNYAQ